MSDSNERMKFREDIRYMMESDWEPTVPSTAECKQQLTGNSKVNNVRSYLGHVTGSDYKKEKRDER